LIEKINAETEAEVSKIKMERDILLKEGKQKIDDIESRK
jgi:hypothetical protein